VAYTERTTGEVIYALKRWEAGHPWPNDPWTIIDRVGFTPREFMAAIKNGGPQSDKLLGFIFAEARRLNEDPLDYVGRMIREAAAMADEDIF